MEPWDRPLYLWLTTVLWRAMTSDTPVYGLRWCLRNGTNPPGSPSSGLRAFVSPLLSHLFICCFFFIVAGAQMKTWNRLDRLLFLKMSKCWDKFTLKCAAVPRVLFIVSFIACSAGTVWLPLFFFAILMFLGLYLWKRRGTYRKLRIYENNEKKKIRTLISLYDFFFWRWIFIRDGHVSIHLNLSDKQLFVEKVNKSQYSVT